MTPDIVVDIGNSRVKFGRCEADGLGRQVSLPPDDPTAWEEHLAEWEITGLVRWAVAGVHPERLERFGQWAAARGDEVALIRDFRQLPLRVGTDLPERVGIDRLLCAVAALARVDPGQPVITISAGTAVTVDLTDENRVFRGGAILPGPWLMALSLHENTAKLPLVGLHKIPNHDPPGRNTEDAITVGVMAALMGGCQMLVTEYAALCSETPAVLMAGGAIGHLIDYDFHPDIGVGGPFPLVLEGIRLAAESLP